MMLSLKKTFIGAALAGVGFLAGHFSASSKDRTPTPVTLGPIMSMFTHANPELTRQIAQTIQNLEKDGFQLDGDKDYPAIESKTYDENNPLKREDVTYIRFSKPGDGHTVAYSRTGTGQESATIDTPAPILPFPYIIPLSEYLRACHSAPSCRP